MTIATRLDKLRFLATEMRLAYVLASHAPDSFVARMIALHVIVRAKDFIEHARQLRRPLMAAGFPVKDFHATKEVYARTFAEYFQIQRDRLGAHVQDFDFWKRIALWNDIETKKIQYLADGAEEIYRGLAALNIPGYVPYSEPPDLAAPGIAATLADFGRIRSETAYVEISTDALAMTRDNATATFSGGSINARGSQLALIKRWIDLQVPHFAKFAAYPEIARIFKARIITDIVSFCDCLVTRPVSATAPQAMEGLDKLIIADGGSAKVITDFVAVSNFDSELARARSLRNQICAHLSIDDAAPLVMLVASLDSFDLKNLLEFFSQVYTVFQKACMEFPMLRLFAADGQRLFGVSPSKRLGIPYSTDAPEPALNMPTPFSDDESVFRSELGRWLDGDEKQKVEARQYFWQGFMRSAVVETVTEIEDLGYGSRRQPHEYRLLHQRIEHFLQACTDRDYAGVVDLLQCCANGYPYALAEVLVRSSVGQSPMREALVCSALGEIAGFPHGSVERFLRDKAKHRLWTIRLEATMALFKMYVRSEGLHRINKRPIALDFGQFVTPLTHQLAPEERLIVLLSMASRFSVGRYASYAKVFAENLDAITAEIRTAAEVYFRKPINVDIRTDFETLIKQYDFIGAALVLVTEMDGVARFKNLRAGLLEAVCRGVITGGGPQAERHLAMCFLLAEHFELALEQARGVAARNPENLVSQISVLTVLSNTPGADEAALREIERLRAQFKLDADEKKSLDDTEREIRARPKS